MIKSLMVAGHRVKVVHRDLDGEDFGYSAHDAKTIFLDSNLNETDNHTTLRHELLEASLLLSGVGFCERYEQEAVVRCVDEVFWPAYDRLLKRLS